MARDEGVVVVSTPEKVLSFAGRKALERYLRNHPGTVIQAVKAIHRGVVEDVTEDYLGRAELGSYLAGAGAINGFLASAESAQGEGNG